MNPEHLRDLLIHAALDWNVLANSDGFAIRIPNTEPPLYVAFGRAEIIVALVGPKPVDGEDDGPAANDSHA